MSSPRAIVLVCAVIAAFALGAFAVLRDGARTALSPAGGSAAAIDASPADGPLHRRAFFGPTPARGRVLRYKLDWQMFAMGGDEGGRGVADLAGTLEVASLGAARGRDVIRITLSDVDAHALSLFADPRDPRADAGSLVGPSAYLEIEREDVRAVRVDPSASPVWRSFAAKLVPLILFHRSAGDQWSARERAPFGVAVTDYVAQPGSPVAMSRRRLRYDGAVPGTASLGQLVFLGDGALEDLIEAEEVTSVLADGKVALAGKLALRMKLDDSRSQVDVGPIPAGLAAFDEIAAAPDPRAPSDATPDAARALLAAYRGEPSPDNARALGHAADTLFRSGQPALAAECDSALLDGLSRASSPESRRAHVAAIAAEGLVSNVEKLAALAKDDDPLVRGAVASSLGLTDVPKARVALFGLAMDPEADVQRAAVSSLGEIVLSESDGKRLVLAVLAGKTSPKVDGDLLSLFARKQYPLALIKPALDVMRERDKDDAKLLARIAALETELATR